MTEQFGSCSGQGDKERSERFFRLFMSNQKRIYAYILMLVANPANADEIMQETSAIMWQKFDEYKPGTSFGAWGVKIARFEILEFCRKQNRSRVLFDGELLELFADHAEKVLKNVDGRLKALQQCMKKLSKRDQRLIQLHYENGFTVKKVAEHVNRPVQGMYKVMNRIHNTLLKCVRWTMISEEIG